MDLAKLKVVSASEAGAWMPLLNPFSGDKTGVELCILGYDASAVVGAGRENARAVAKSDSEDPMQSRKVALAISALADWRGTFEWKGQEKDFDPELAKKILSDPEFSWIVDQIDHFGSKRGNYFDAAKHG